MEMQLYALHVIPFIVLIYVAFLFFIRPPSAVGIAALLGGLTLGVINALADLIAFYASWWHYTVSGLFLHLPLPYYTPQIFVYGGIIYLLIWRFWNGRGRWFSWLLLIAVPLVGFGRDLLSSQEPNPALVWTGVLAGPLDFLLWLLMFYAGFLVFRQLTRRQEQEVKVA